jgi:hypothetical protein
LIAGENESDELRSLETLLKVWLPADKLLIDNCCCLRGC